MNVKARTDSILHGLAPMQRVKLETWLFEENLGLKQVAERCQEEFGVEVGTSSVARYRRREQARCDLERKVRVQIDEEQLAGQGVNATVQFEALLRKMMQVAMKTAQVSTTPAELKVVSDYARALIAARREGHEGLRAATTREKFEFDAATACLIHQVKIQSIAADDALDDGERIQKIREELFGPDLPE